MLREELALIIQPSLVLFFGPVPRIPTKICLEEKQNFLLVSSLVEGGEEEAEEEMYGTIC